jgi:hypothetical protein
VGGDTESATKNLHKRIRGILPPLVSSAGLANKIQVLSEKADRLGRLHGFGMSREERYAAKVLKEDSEKKAVALATELERCRKLSAVHFIACYDAVRLYSSGVSVLGTGTREFCFRVSLRGLDFSWMLPRGFGEPSPKRKREEDKANREAERHHAAASAIEREKKRRATTPEEREILQLESNELSQPQRDAEETTLFNTALDEFERLRLVLSNSSSPLKKNVAFDLKEEEKIGVVALFKNLSNLVSKRYPLSTKAAICLNNVGAVITEVSIYICFTFSKLLIAY